MTTTINFNDLSRGTIVDNEYQAQGVTISAFGGCNLAMIFDTSNPTGGDYDLQTSNLGNVLIISEDGDQHDPDDNASGGTLRFAFDEPSRVEELTFLDIEEGAYVRFYDLDGNLISKQYVGTTPNNGQKVVHFDVENVAYMDVQLCGSGAVDNLKFDTPTATVGPDGIVEGTDGADVIDVNYEGDPEGDRIDAGDALLPGEAPQDDIVLAGGGNDKVYAGQGNDDIYGGDGHDQLFGQAGNDLIDGGDGDDMLFGGDGDDVLRGGNGNDKIEASKGDDCVEGGAGNDDLWGGIGNDVIDGGAGNDSINAGPGNDQVYGGSGDDNILGGDGNDTIYGDSSKPGTFGGEVVRESFEWDLVNSNLPQNFVQDTGNAKVTFNTLQETGSSNTIVGTDLQNVDGIDDGGQGIDHCSSLDNVLNGKGNEADYRLTFDKSVYNVDFRINDIDGDGVVKVTAYDADGNKIHIDLQGGDRLTMIDTDEIAGVDTADSKGGYLPDTSAEYSMLVSIPGPVARIEIEHDQNGVNNSGINITDIYFDVPTADTGPDGDDVINAGAGADVVFGEGGDDVIDGGDGADQISGGDGSDRILGGAGDTVDGGAGGTDYDILDLTGKGPFYLDNVENDSNGNGINGTVVFVDEDGNPTGGTIIFTEIEEVRGDNVGRPPEASDDTATVEEDGSVTIPVLDNDSDPDGDPLEVVDASSPNGDVTINPDGTITFTPDENFNGDTTITYTVTDPDGNTDTATVTVNVAPVNDDPIANDDTATTAEDTPVTIPVLGNDTDVDGDDLSVTEATSPDGTVEINPDGTVTFTPNADFTGIATIEYTVSDGNGGTDTATVTIDVTPVADAPIALDDMAETDEDTPVTINVLGNDSDPDGDPLEVSEATSPNGDVTINTDGTITFTPDENFNGDTTITYTVTDPDGNTDTATVTVNVAPVNDAPDAVDDADTTEEDTPITVDLLANDFDVDGDELTVVSATVPAAQGTLVNNGDGTVTFTPAANFTGEATISYTIRDEEGLTDSALHTITVTAVADAPIALDDMAETDEDTPVTIDVLGNDSDPDGDPLEVSEATSPNGDVTINTDGTITFTPDENFNGDTTITYTVTDPDGNTDTATVTVNVAPVNDGPLAEDDDATTPEDTPVKIAILDNDSDPDGDPLKVVAATSPDGTVEVNPDGTITFKPNPGFVGEAMIDYTIEDPDGAQDSAKVTITVTNVNERPDAVDDTASGVSGTPVVIDALANDTDPDEDPLTITDVSVPPEQGTAEIVNNQVVFTPDAGFEGVAEISYTITDPDGLTDSAVITVNVQNGIVNGTDGNDVIDVNYLGDPGGDRVDNNDEILPGEGPNDDIIEAGAGDDTVIAGAGDDEVYGGSGNDTITTGDGSDEVYGGTGDDVIDTDNGSFLIDKGYPGVFPGEEGTDAVFDDRDFVDGGDGNDTIRTGDDADTIFGGDGNDRIDGGIDDDIIDGGADDDRIVGGEGNDIIDGGSGDDTIYAGNDPDRGLDEFDIEDDGTNPVGPDLRPDNGQDIVRGGEGNDTIFGADDDDRLFGDEGNDYIDGQIDDDFIDGGTGDDTLLGGQGDDTIIGGSGDDTIDGGIGNDDLSGGADRDTFTNVNAGDVVDGGGAGDDYDVLDLTGSAGDGSLRVDITGPDSNGNGFDGTVTYFDEDGNETGTIEFTEIEEVIPCFTPGTMIATPRGEVPVEQLEVGDRVITRDNGIQEIRWVGHRAMKGAELARAPHLKPVLIRQGALGNGLPERDMTVSPNHRMLVANDKTALYFEESEVLVSAKHLTGLEGVDVVDPSWTTYIHLMFDQHEVILSDGAWSESFQPGDQTLDAMGNAQRNEIFELFPELKTREGIEAYTSARRSLKKHEARLLMQ